MVKSLFKISAVLLLVGMGSLTVLFLLAFSVRQLFSPEGDTAANNSQGEVNTSVYQDKELRKLADKLGLVTDKVELRYGADGDFDDELGLYTSPDEVLIKRGLDKTQEMSTLSHEYLHYLWEHEITEDDKKNLKTSLDNLYANDQWMRQRMDSYFKDGCDEACRVEEMHAIACTEVPDYVLSQSYVDWCDRLLPQRHLFVPN